MKRKWILLCAAVLLLCAGGLHAAQTLRFEPLNDTLARYRILRIPEAGDYPDVPAVAILSVYEYRQLEIRHERRVHKIVKVLTAAGKEYTTIKIPCFSSCRIDARTIKANGKIFSLPAKDLIRSERLTEYSSPFTYVQFAMPGVEPGDIIEYTATIVYPQSFFMDDFRFAEPYPIVKGVFVLSHPDDFSYSYVRYSPPGTSPIQASRDTFYELQTPFLRTTFVVDNVPAAANEPYAPTAREGLPGLRILMDGRRGTKFEVFKDWWNYGTFLAEQAEVSPVMSGAIRTFVREATGNNIDPATMVKLLYQAAEKRIQIVDETLPMSGFSFLDPELVFEEKVGAPHDFALFLAVCFKSLKWGSDLVLVNSHDQAETGKEAAFPLDLDLVFLNVKTPAGEFLLDCNGNGMPANVLSSTAMNRFALGVPVTFDAARMSNVPYTTTMPFREGNKSRLELNAAAGSKTWNIDFRWFLGGEFQADFIRVLRQKGEEEFRKSVALFLRRRIRAEKLDEIGYQLLSTGIELKGKATLTRRMVSQDLELIQNELWDSGFDLRQYLFDNRSDPLLLPVAGEISSSYRIQLGPGVNAVLPASYEMECNPIRYSLSFRKQNQEVRIDEKIFIRDLRVKQPGFAKFVEFLDQYYAKHFWSVLMSSRTATASTLGMR